MRRCVRLDNNTVYMGDVLFPDGDRLEAPRGFTIRGIQNERKVYVMFSHD